MLHSHVAGRAALKILLRDAESSHCWEWVLYGELICGRERERSREKVKNIESVVLKVVWVLYASETCRVQEQKIIKVIVSLKLSLGHQRKCFLVLQLVFPYLSSLFFHKHTHFNRKKYISLLHRTTPRYPCWKWWKETGWFSSEYCQTKSPVLSECVPAALLELCAGLFIAPNILRW